LRVEQQNSSCRLEIADDGQGFVSMEGNGLRGMRERVEMLGGTLDRRNKSGTTLTITLPLKEIAVKDSSQNEIISGQGKTHELESSR
jgi:glucose-6-phosphate-specific signal transduction histidine kinase